MRWSVATIPLLLGGCFLDRGGIVHRDGAIAVTDAGSVDAARVDAGRSDAGTDAGMCVPTGPEICDGLDNDCDPATRDGATQIGMPCDGADLDLCQEDQVLDCGPAGLMCSLGSDTLEICNGADDNCDGLPDNDARCPCRDATSRGHNYLFCTTATTWQLARSACPGGYTLVKIDDATEQLFIEGIVSTIANTDFWIGATDAGMPGDYRWIADNNPLVYVNWGNLDLSGDCVELDGDMSVGPRWSWNDTPCDESNPYICETLP